MNQQYQTSSNRGWGRWGAFALAAFSSAATAQTDLVLDLDEGARDTWAATRARIETRGHVLTSSVSPLVEDAELERWFERGREVHGNELEDLRGFYQVRLSARSDVELERDWIASLEGVEDVSSPASYSTPGDNPPNPAPSLGAGQSFYWTPNLATVPVNFSLGGVPITTPMGGHNMQSVQQWGSGGANVQVGLIEFAFQSAPLHEDLSAANITTLSPIPGDTFVPNVPSDVQHGTATLGLLVADQDVPGAPTAGFGVTGAVPGATTYFIPMNSVQSGSVVPQAITAAMTVLAPGDVLLIELQVTGANGAFAPVSLVPAVQAAMALATANGIHVVEPAGNGGQSVDVLGLVNTGSIMVGAVDPATGARLGFSNFGNRVDVCAQGLNVTSLGYGDFTYAFGPGAGTGGNPDEFYTLVYSGTSSASAITAGLVAAAVDARRTFAAGLPLPVEMTPAEMRSALINYVPAGYAGNQFIGQYVDGFSLVSHMSAIPYGFGNDTTCLAGPLNCAPPRLEAYWTCPQGDFYANAAVGSPYALRVTGVPSFPGFFTTFYFSSGAAQLPVGLPAPLWIDLATFSPFFVTVPNGVACLGICGSSPSICGEGNLPLPLPNDPAAIGLVFTSQAVTTGPDATAPNGLYVGSTNGLETTILP